MDPVAGGLGACLVSMLGITTGKLAMTEGLLVGGVPAWQVALGIWTGVFLLDVDCVSPVASLEMGTETAS